MPSNCTIISWKGKKEMASLLKGSKGGAFQYSRRGLRLRRRGAYGIHRASGPRCQGLCRKVVSLRSGGRRLAVRKTIEYQIGALPRTPFPAAREFPSRGNEKYGEEKQRVIYFMYHSAVSPFGGERSEPITRMLNMLYDAESQSRNADFILIARRAMSIIMPPFGGHVHIEYHNHSYPRTSLRHFVALLP